MGRHALTLSASVLLALGIAVAASAATHTTKQQTTTGSYRLVLVIGAAEQMTMNGKTGERMIGGANAACKMGMNMPGMLDMVNGAKQQTCNHHVELHVYARKSGKVVKGARVSISLVNSKSHASLVVPIMTMMGATMGASDYHYGNNVYVPAGTYTVAVAVNGTRASFKSQVN